MTPYYLTVSVPVFSSVDIWYGSNMSVWRTSVTSGPVELVRGDLHQANHVTVVSVVECDNFTGTRMCSGSLKHSI